jgi:dethiobiotin synthetase
MTADGARVILVTGTGTGVGKTVTTAALAACALGAGRRVAVVKPVQTGVDPGEPGDLAEVGRLTGLTDLHEFVRFSEPLAPATAARRLGEPGPDLEQLAGRIAELADRDQLIVEGAGGALVRFNDRGQGICELARVVREVMNCRLRVVLVTGARLGALHDAAATSQALRAAGVPADQLVIGDWPVEPGLAERCNLADLGSYGQAPVGGVILHGADQLTVPAFAKLAVSSLTPTLGGTCNIAKYIKTDAA